jgi:hypothetical protein
VRSCNRGELARLGLVVALFGFWFHWREIRPPAFGVGSKVFEKIG